VQNALIVVKRSKTNSPSAYSFDVAMERPGDFAWTSSRESAMIEDAVGHQHSAGLYNPLL
jgi:hypothetical protein